MPCDLTVQQDFPSARTNRAASDMQRKGVFPVLGSFLDAHPLAGMMDAPAVCPFPPASDRAAWEGISPQNRDDLMRMAAHYRAIPYPMLTATQFMAFVRSGSRRAYENPYFLRRKKLIAALLGCCVTGRPDDLDDVIDGLWCICEETSWVISAHNGSAHAGMRPPAQRPLPDVTNPYIDLFAAQTGMILSLTCALLADSLDRVAPVIRRRVGLEIERRILTPFATRDDYWWMGFIRKDLNNWTPWIVSDVMLTASLCISDRVRLCEVLDRACRMLDRWLDVMPEDGGCDEGAGYWNMAGGSMLDCLETLEQLTRGRMTFWTEEKIRRIAAFPATMQLANGWFVNFADCDARPFISGERLQYAGERLHDDHLTAVGAALRQEPSHQISDTPLLRRLLQELFHPHPAQTAAPARSPRDAWLPSLEVRMLERGGAILVAKGGHNGESHNHNDVGAFILYLDGEPAVVDAGNLVYTAKTFSSERYTLWNTRSRNHNVPLIGQCEQQPGALHRAKCAACHPDGMSLDMAGAYGEEAGVTALSRRLALDDAGVLTLTDSILLREEKPVCWVFMLRCRPEQQGRSVTAGPVRLELPAGMQVRAEEIVIEDERMARSFPGSLWRLTCEDAPALRHDAAFTFRKNPGGACGTSPVGKSAKTTKEEP